MSEELVEMWWRADASGFVAGFAGRQASAAMPRSEAEEIRRVMPNGHDIEFRSVEGAPS